MTVTEFPTDNSYDYTGTIAVAFLAMILLSFWVKSASFWGHKRLRHGKAK